MHIVVLGAGVIGTTAAWFLRADGHEVTVVDRQPVPGNETSFANGGQISVSHAEPWANPSAPLKVLSWIGREDSPLLVRMRRDPAMWRWFARFSLYKKPSLALAGESLTPAIFRVVAGQSCRARFCAAIPLR